MIYDFIGLNASSNGGFLHKRRNKKIGGVKNSQHITGKAVDIVIKGITTNYLAFKINELISKGKMLQGGIGIYDTFVHYDIRGTKARWDNRKK
jgi:uncharacterized protein YcbK (DUF882 family)